MAKKNSIKEGAKVEVICTGVLGKKLLKKGDVTDDPDYVALLGDKRNLVRAVDEPATPATGESEVIK